MTSGLRFRIITLQVVLVAVLAFAAGFMFWGSSYVHSTITSQLKAQQIVFPSAGSAEITPKALTPKGGTIAQGRFNSQQMNRYAGQTLTNGNQAKVWADSFIAVHLSEMGMTYSQASTASMKNPNNANLQTLVATIFKGTTLRGMLLNSYGWWQVGDYTGMAAVLATLGAVVVFLTLVFESVLAWKERAAAALQRAALKPSTPLTNPV